MKSEWGKSDCLTEVLGEFNRPEWLRTNDSVKAVAEFKRKCDGDFAKGVEQFVKQHAQAYSKVDVDETWRPGDVVIGKTREYEFVVAKVHSSCLPVIRTEIGYSYARFIEVISVWRLKRCQVQL